MSPTTLYLTALPIFVTAVIIEGFYFRRKRIEYSWTNTLVNFILAISFLLADALTAGVVASVSLAAYSFRLTDMPNTWPALIFLFILVDFTYYWIHRFGHTIRWVWALHSVHHSAEQITFSVAYRLGWTRFFTGVWLLLVPICWLGFDPQVVASVYAINQLYQFWLHTEAIPKLGFIEKFLNTPSHHRVHHATNPEFLDMNYGGVFIFWDKLFGTFAAEKDSVKNVYGLLHPVKSLNPIKIAFAEYIHLFQDLKSARSFREVVGFLYQSPGWRPDGKGKTSEDIRRAAAAAM